MIRFPSEGRGLIIEQAPMMNWQHATATLMLRNNGIGCRVDGIYLLTYMYQSLFHSAANAMKPVHTASTCNLYVVADASQRADISLRTH